MRVSSDETARARLGLVATRLATRMRAPPPVVHQGFPRWEPARLASHGSMRAVGCREACAWRDASSLRRGERVCLRRCVWEGIPRVTGAPPPPVLAPHTCWPHHQRHRRQTTHTPPKKSRRLAPPLPPRPPARPRRAGGRGGALADQAHGGGVVARRAARGPPRPRRRAPVAGLSALQCRAPLIAPQVPPPGPGKGPLTGTVTGPGGVGRGS